MLNFLELKLSRKKQKFELFQKNKNKSKPIKENFMLITLQLLELMKITHYGRNLKKKKLEIT